MIDKHKLFPPNELYTFELDSPAISRVEYKIGRTELANKYVKKTTRRHQNNKKLIGLDDELKRTIYNHNKFNLFDAISKEIDRQIPLILEKNFNNFASVSDISFGKDQ